MEMEGEKERLQSDEKECNEAETDRTSDEEEEEEDDSEGATLLWQEGYNEDNEGLPIMHWEALSLRIAELEKQEEERREKNAKAGGSPDNSWMEDRATRAENWDYEDDSCNSHVMALTSRLQTQMNLQLCFINNSESEDEEEKEEGSGKKDATNKESAQLQKSPAQSASKSDKSTKSSKSSKSGKSEKPKSSRGFRNTLRSLRDRLRADHRTSTSSALKDAIVQRRHLERTDLQTVSIKELNKHSTSLRQTIQDLSSELVGLLQIRDQLRTEQDAMLLEVQDLTSI